MDHFRKLLNRPAKGLSLIEMMIVLALSVTLVLAFYSFLSTHIMGAAEESSEIRVQNDLRVITSDLVQELEGAHLYFLDPLGTFLCYQVPQLGTNNTSFLLDSKGNPVYGAYPFDGGAFIEGGYYELFFVDHIGPKDLLIENNLKPAGASTGQNISGTLGGTGNTVAYNKGYVFGHFEIQVFNKPLAVLSSANVAFSGNQVLGPTGTPVATPNPARVIGGKTLRQIDILDTATNKRTYPWGGGFFYMRHNTPQLILNSAGTAAGTVANPQKAGDLNASGFPEEADCDSFTDKNYSGVYDTGEVTATAGTSWRGSLKILIRSFDPKNLMTDTADMRDKSSVIRTVTTKVKIRN